MHMLEVKLSQQKPRHGYIIPTESSPPVKRAVLSLKYVVPWTSKEQFQIA